MTKNNMTNEEMLQQLRADKESGKCELTNLFYGVLRDAHPVVVEHMERNAAEFMMMGAQVGAHLKEISKDPKKVKELKEKLAMERSSKVPFGDVFDANTPDVDDVDKTDKL